MRDGTFVDRRASDRLTLGDLLQVYLEKHATLNRRGDQHGYLVRKWLLHPICNRRLSSLQGRDFAVLRDERLAVVGKKTVREDLVMFRRALELGRKEWGFSLPTNPIDDITIPSPGAGRDRRLVGDDEARLLEATTQQSSPWLRPVIELALETAMRRGELIALEWAHVDLDRRVAHLPKTKNGTKRDVPLSARAVEILEALPRRLNGEVFPINADDLTHKFGDLCRKAGIEDLRFHDLRHEAISRLFERTTLNVMEIASISGHKTLQMLERYTHLRADNLAQKLSLGRAGS
jgi:integrase